MTCNDMMCDKWLNERQLLVGVLVNDHTLGCSVRFCSNTIEASTDLSLHDLYLALIPDLTFRPLFSAPQLRLPDSLRQRT